MKNLEELYKNGEKIEIQICSECPDNTGNCEENKYMCQRFCDKMVQYQLGHIEERF